MRRDGFEALFFLLFLGAMRQMKCVEADKVRYFLPHNFASNFEALPHGNSQQSLTPHKAGALFFHFFLES